MFLLGYGMSHEVKCAVFYLQHHVGERLGMRQTPQ